MFLDLNKFSLIVVLVFILASFTMLFQTDFEIQSANALQSQGVSQGGILSDKVCGLELCGISQSIDKKIFDYLTNFEWSLDKTFDSIDLDRSVHIVKTSTISKDFLLVHYSDGNWDFLNNAELINDVPNRGGAIIDLGSGLQSDAQETSTGRLELSQTEIIRPLSNETTNIRIYGNVGDSTAPNVLLSITFPDKPLQDFILSIDNNGDFEAQLDVDKNTPIGEYRVTAKSAYVQFGVASFVIRDHTAMSQIISTVNEKRNSIVLSTDDVSIPTSHSQIQTLKISGTVADYTRGNAIQLNIIYPNNDTSTVQIFANKDGDYSTFLNITPEFPEGMTEIIVRYHTMEVARTILTAISPVLSLQ